jgi:glycosyltransferase involved in cell wall biosynthesis
VGKKLAEKQKVYFYSANPGDFSIYAHENISVFPPNVFPELLANLAKHSVGLVGSPYPLLDFEDSMPNKLFEYISAGIPVMVFNSPEAKAFVEENKLGVGVADTTEALEAFEMLSRNYDIPKARWGFAMESEIPKLTGFYKEVMHCFDSPKTTNQTVSLNLATDVASATNARKS